jgi:FkbM family methyltransferase
MVELNEFSPIDVSDVDIYQWTNKSNFPIRLAQLWARHAPRGKSWVPRLIGRLLENRTHQYIVTSSGARLAIALPSLDVFVHILNRGGTWEKNVLDTCASFLREEQVFYDLGANVGYMAIEIAMRFDDKVTVVAVEPQPDLARTIALSARLNNFHQIKVFELMLGDKEGSGELFLTSHSLHASAIAREKHARALDRRVTTVDRLVADANIPPPDVIKIDVEGSELAILRGARDTLGKYRPFVLFEYDENADRFGYSLTDLLGCLSSSADYEFHWVATDGRLIPLDSLSGSRTPFKNMLAKPIGRHPL